MPLTIPSVPVSGTLNNGVQLNVLLVATLLAASNSNRKKLIIQNVGIASIRIGTSGVTATTGMRLTPDSTVVFATPNIPTNDIWAVSEIPVGSAVLVQEVV